MDMNQRIDHEDRINRQWRILNPDWKSGKLKGERELLYENIEQDEELVGIIDGHFGPDLQQAKFGSTLRNGIIVATDRRVLMVDKSLFSTELAEIGYDSIEAITHSTGAFAGGLRITGRGGVHFRIENVVPKDKVRPFAETVRARLPGNAPVPLAPTVQEEKSSSAGTSIGSAVEELEKLAGLVDRGFVSQAEFDIKKKELLGL